MESYLTPGLYDLISPDGSISSYELLNEREAKVTVEIEKISPAFKGFSLDPGLVFFNIKSTLAQLGLNGVGTEYSLDKEKRSARVRVHLTAYGKLAELLLQSLSPGAFIGKLFAADDRRKVQNPDYLLRMFNRNDRDGQPLLYLGNPLNSEHLVLEKKEGETLAFLSLLPGTIQYPPFVQGFMPTLGAALHKPAFQLRQMIQLVQRWDPNLPRKLQENEILLVKTQPLHIRTAFARVRQDLLPEGFYHTTASILEPDTKASGDVYEFFGSSTEEVSKVPLEFYTLEPHREHVFFADRDQLKHCLEDQNLLFKTFDTAPLPLHHKAAAFIVKSEHLLNLQPTDWVSRDPHFYDFPGMIYHAERQHQLVDKYIEQQAIYPFLRAMQKGLITSQGVLFSRYFPSPLLKKTLLSDRVHRCLKGIYFKYPSHSYGDFFSHEDRAMLHDLAQFAIPVYWVDETTKQVLQYVPKPGKDTGMFVPLPLIEDFLKAASFGVYGSNLLSFDLEKELLELFAGLEELRFEVEHPLLNQTTPIALITGGGPGVMEVGNKVAKALGLLSCANIVDFRAKSTSVVHEQQQNPYVDIKMTYRLDRLVERQAEFNLDFPIFLKGGIGTDFEYSLEELRRKVGGTAFTPILLFGPPEYWKEKITPRFRCNLENGTIAGSEWISNCFYCVQNAKQGLLIYEKFLTGNLMIGKGGPIFEDGFVIVETNQNTSN